jgi:hypothetical protein
VLIRIKAGFTLNLKTNGFVMRLTRPNGGMFGIKLVGADHPAFPFHQKEATPALMNFPDSAEGRRIAAGVPIGHKSLVYLMAPVKRFYTAIEYIKWDSSVGNVLKEGTKAANHHGAVELMEVCYPHFAKIWRCIRMLAWINDPKNAPTPDFDFHQGDIMFDIEEAEYLELFNAIPWDWTATH